MQLPTEYIHFDSREARSNYVAHRFQQYLQTSVLDVGCFEAPLRKKLDVHYVGVDMVGAPDIQLNLEECMRLPFEDNAFHCVMCIDVLEHLDQLHRIFAELIRVSSSYVLVALPNCWCDARRPIERGKGAFGHYGLPAAQPKDRHKWFFSFSQARTFLMDQAQKHRVTPVEMFATEKPRPWPVRTLRKLRYPGERYHNRYSQTVWSVLQTSDNNA
ncbi:MAG: class I SAM-dependent methyltransferase [Candidatus Pacebacteria bacterium]|nr:class I SAM-dependent methyltransferase [Candidatus Paceibacterota bacterium]